MARIIPNTLKINPKIGEIRFRVSASNGERVEFPVEFLNDDIFVYVESYFDGDSFITCGTTRQAVLDRTGFTLSKLGIPVDNRAPYWDNRNDPVSVLVKGDLKYNPEEEDLVCRTLTTTVA